MTPLDSTLVVRGCGVLGHHIVKQLMEAQATNITVFDVNIEKNTFEDVTYVKGSISNAAEVRQVLEKAKPTIVIHTASPGAQRTKNTNDIFHKVNVEGTRNLLEAINIIGATKILIYTSSSSVVHDNISHLLDATEDMPYYPLSKQPIAYTRTKAEAEQMVLAANRTNGLLTAAIRPTILFGENDEVMPVQIANARAGRARLQVGNNTNLADWVYAGNCAHAHILAVKALLRIDMTKPLKPEDRNERVDGEAFFITNDDPWPFWDLPQTVFAMAGYSVKKEDIWIVPTWVFFAIAVIAEWSVWLTSLGKRESGLTRSMVKFFSMTRTFDITKAKERLGYRPLVSMEEGIRRAVESFLVNEKVEEKKNRGEK